MSYSRRRARPVEEVVAIDYETTNLCKESSFDVYRIGSKYFRPLGWGLKPLIRNVRVTHVESH